MSRENDLDSRKALRCSYEDRHRHEDRGRRFAIENLPPYAIPFEDTAAEHACTPRTIDTNHITSIRTLYTLQYFASKEFVESYITVHLTGFPYASPNRSSATAVSFAFCFSLTSALKFFSRKCLRSLSMLSADDLDRA